MSDIEPALTEDGFTFVPTEEMRPLLEQTGSLADWQNFADSWNDLVTDTYMADKGRYRKRRYAVYAANEKTGIIRVEHQAHFQTLDYNPLHGGVERWFEPILPAIGDGPSMMTILEFCRKLFSELADGAVFSPPLAGGAEPNLPLSSGSNAARGGGHQLLPTSGLLSAPPPNLPRKGGGIHAAFAAPQPPTPNPHQWHIETHQFRIETGTQAGKPTPEGMHRDGRDYVLVLLIRRENIQSGVTTIHDLQQKPLGSFTLAHPFDAALVDDNRVYHGVTPVTPVDPAKPAYRDVLVVTFKAK